VPNERPKRLRLFPLDPQAFDARPDTPVLSGRHCAGAGVEVRQLHPFALEALAVDFPFVRSVIVVRSEVTIKKSGTTTTDTRYYLASAEHDERTPELWQWLVRGHWGGVEIRNHWRRDAFRARTAPAPRHPTALA